MPHVAEILPQLVSAGVDDLSAIDLCDSAMIDRVIATFDSSLPSVEDMADVGPLLQTNKFSPLNDESSGTSIAAPINVLRSPLAAIIVPSSSQIQHGSGNVSLVHEKGASPIVPVAKQGKAKGGGKGGGAKKKNQEVTLEVEILACHLKFFVSMVYGYNLASDRDRLWQELRVLHSSFTGQPWMLMGDFNVVWKASESIFKPPLPLRDEISWGLANGRSKSVHGLIFKLIFAASIYFLWGERNNRIFKAKGMPWQGVFDLIVENVWACLCGWRNVERTRENVRILEGWHVPFVVFM
ncbi:hypothetical protein RHGRI_004706 [Rhododendron griersonianum]|uniref:RNA-directed DNA polymerase, eukaryota, Reverse transcriptase zinc-binding domain protein n=1 Tax=Rhododendron griersonianum TaxID=479676 RepID=A0AAV6L9L9_9ERIC|nr:hypothetical protein RHGRI_004706 [Rhododendron griersonianum]